MNTSAILPNLPGDTVATTSAEWLTQLTSHGVLRWQHGDTNIGLLLAVLLDINGWQGDVLSLTDALPTTARAVGIQDVLAVMGALGYRVHHEKMLAANLKPEDLPGLFVPAQRNGALRIYVNNVPRNTVDIGGRAVIYLSPYATYRIHLAQETGDMIAVSGGERKVTLYPGNVVHLQWQAHHYSVVVAHMVDGAGAPLVGATLTESDNTAITDDTGQFQAELTRPELLHFTTQAGTSCSATLPGNVAPTNGVLLYREAVKCE